MPDDRFLHKRLGHSQKVGKLTDFEFIVWVSYLLSADDFGVLRMNAAALCADHDRLDTKPVKSVQRALDKLRDVGLVSTFEHQGRIYIYQCDWQDWQKVDYPRTTIHPAPPSDDLSTRTKELFAKHPGGFGRKVRGTVGEHSPNRSANVHQTFPEPFGDRSGEITLEPLAVSRKPLAIAVSQKPVPPADGRSKRPIFKGQRLVVFDWMLEDLYRLLGKPAGDGLDVHSWFYDLDARVAASGEMVPQRDGGKWLQQQALDEAQKRGLISAPEHKSKLTLALEKASNGW